MKEHFISLMIMIGMGVSVIDKNIAGVLFYIFLAVLFLFTKEDDKNDK